MIECHIFAPTNGNGLLAEIPRFEVDYCMIYVAGSTNETDKLPRDAPCAVENSMRRGKPGGLLIVRVNGRGCHVAWSPGRRLSPIALPAASHGMEFAAKLFPVGRRFFKLERARLPRS